MAGLDWFTSEAQLRAEEIYKSFHPETNTDKKEPPKVRTSEDKNTP